MPTWQARMIAADQEFDGAPLLRTEFRLDDGHGEIVTALLHSSALGICEVWVNGAPVSADVLGPGWSSYEWRLRYRTHDVTGLLRPTSVIGVALGNGWFRGRLGWNGSRNVYGTEIAAWVQLEIEFADGHRQVVVSDESWHAGPGAVTENDLYDGQSIDARRHDPGWRQPGAGTEGWTGVHRVDFDPTRLSPYIGPPVIRQEELAPARIWTSPAGRTLVDFGQNLVGWVRVRVRGERGHTVTVRHAEVLEDDELGTRPLRTARATDRYVLSGSDDEFEPTFTFHGFRYVELTGWPGEITEGALAAVVIGSDMARIGHFECSDPMLNQLFSNVVWGMRGNFVDLPTDCPQRDERLGWTGDIAVFSPTATYLYDSADFLRDWLADLALEQRHHNGIVPFVVPDILKYEDTPSGFPEVESTAVWSDAGVWVPWAIWQAYGDPTVLLDQFDSITAHTRRVRSLLSPDGLWDRGFQFGDWLDPQAPPDQPFLAKADNGVVATACAYRTADLTARIAAVLGRDAEQDEFARMAADVRAAFNTHYVASGEVDGGRVTSDCPTVYALAITFGLLDPDDLGRAGSRLAELVRKNDHRVSTGFAGTPFITDALTATGHVADAYRLLLQDQCPSWLYSVTMGATTVWERWDSMLPDGSINPGEMTSFNHYALGAVADWMRRTIGGLTALEPGYRTILVAPQPGGGVNWARSDLLTPHGPAAVHWTIDAGRITLEVTVPAGATAVVRLSGRPDQELSGGHHVVTSALEVPL